MLSTEDLIKKCADKLIFLCNKVAVLNSLKYPSNQTHLPTPVKTCNNVLKNKVGALKWIKTKLITGLNK